MIPWTLNSTSISPCHLVPLGSCVFQVNPGPCHLCHSPPPPHQLPGVTRLGNRHTTISLSPRPEVRCQRSLLLLPLPDSSHTCLHLLEGWGATKNESPCTSQTVPRGMWFMEGPAWRRPHPLPGEYRDPSGSPLTGARTCL